VRRKVPSRASSRRKRLLLSTTVFSRRTPIRKVNGIRNLVRRTNQRLSPSRRRGKPRKLPEPFALCLLRTKGKLRRAVNLLRRK
jgi:hypothetical protein